MSAAVTDISLELAGRDESAARLLMEWRNDPVIRESSFHRQEKTWETFWPEFVDTYVADCRAPLYFILKNGQRAGYIRFRRLENDNCRGLQDTDISIGVAPQFRGMGIGPRALELSRGIARSLGYHRIVAEVRTENPGSRKAFEKAGFVFQDTKLKTVPDTGEKVEIHSLVADLTGHTRLPDGTAIGDGNPCYVIAEAGSNWRMGSIRRDEKMARTLIDVAVEAGCNAVKFQTYRPETTYVENAGESDYLSQAGIKESIRDIFSDLAMPYEMVEGLATYCRAIGITFMSSVFSVDDLEAVDPFTPVHKLASYEISHLRLIEAMAATGKPAILSTGASSPEDIDWAVTKFRSMSQAPLSLMQCTARYPAPLSALNLSVIPWMKARWGVPAGLSDHSRDPITGPLSAVALGANLIEKHYTLHNDLPGPDHKFAVTAAELKEMVAAIRRAEEAVGDGVKRVHQEEEELYHYARRGVQAIASIEAGAPFVEGENFAILRPGKQRRGMHPKNIDRLQGARAQRLIPVGDGIGEDDVSY